MAVDALTQVNAGPARRPTTASRGGGVKDPAAETDGIAYTARCMFTGDGKEVVHAAVRPSAERTWLYGMPFDTTPSRINLDATFAPDGIERRIAFAVPASCRRLQPR